jgi:hypothetical protein
VTSDLGAIQIGIREGMKAIDIGLWPDGCDSAGASFRAITILRTSP